MAHQDAAHHELNAHHEHNGGAHHHDHQAADDHDRCSHHYHHQAAGSGAIQIGASVKIISIRNDISGTADGIQLAASDSRVERPGSMTSRPWVSTPTTPTTTGSRSTTARRIVILNNRIEIAFDGLHQNAAIFFQPGTGNAVPAPQVVGNYLEGGGFTLRLEGTTTSAIMNRLKGGWGHAYCWYGATVAQWSANRDTSGAAVGMP